MNIETIQRLNDHFKDEATCRAHLAAMRWGVDGIPACPYCGVVGAYVIAGGKRYKCRDKGCNKSFSVTVGTIFENTKLPLRLWFMAIYLCTNTSKGVSSVNLAKLTGCTQKSAWFVLSRIREIVADRSSQWLASPAQVDETYIGGSDTNRHENKRKGHGKDKAPVVGIRGADGRVVVRAVVDSSSTSLIPVLRQYVQIGSEIHSDEWRAYRELGADYQHERINHSSGQYVRHKSDGSKVHTNGIENFWSLFSRGLNGIYHAVSPKHLDRYCQEYAYRYNGRGLSQGERFGVALSQAEGRRLTYRRLIGKDKPQP